MKNMAELWMLLPFCWNLIRFFFIRDYQLYMSSVNTDNTVVELLSLGQSSLLVENNQSWF